MVARIADPVTDELFRKKGLMDFLISNTGFFNTQSGIRNLQWASFLYKYPKSA